jgi:hypothetical protein
VCVFRFEGDVLLANQSLLRNLPASSLPYRRGLYLSHVLDLFEALEIGEPGIVSGSWALCLLFDRATVLPLRVHETHLVLADDGGTHIVSH